MILHRQSALRAGNKEESHNTLTYIFWVPDKSYPKYVRHLCCTECGFKLTIKKWNKNGPRLVQAFPRDYYVLTKV